MAGTINAPTSKTHSNPIPNFFIFFTSLSFLDSTFRNSFLTSLLEFAFVSQYLTIDLLQATGAVIVT